MIGVHGNFGKDEPKTINWDRPMLDRFKVIIKRADEVKAATIMFDGNEFDVAYGKYLIEFLDGKLN